MQSPSQPQDNEQPATPYAILGEDGVKALSNAFYDELDRADDLRELRDMHKGDLSEMKKKLAMYLIGWMGGPPVYQAVKGTVCLTDPHAPYHIGPRQRDQWLTCMDRALEAIDASETLTKMLHGPMRQVAEAVRNAEQDEPPKRDASIIAVGR